MVSADGGSAAPLPPRPRWRRALAGVARIPFALVLAFFCARAAIFAEAFVGVVPARLSTAVALAALVARRPVPGLGAVRRRSVRLPLLGRPGSELLVVLVAALWAAALAASVPAMFRLSKDRAAYRVEDLVHGWRTPSLAWFPARRELVAVHGGGAEQYAFSLVDLSGEPPVARFWPTPWRDDPDRVTALGDARVVLAHSRHAEGTLRIDLATRTAEVRDEHVLGSTYDAAADRLYLVVSGEASPFGGAPSEVVAVARADYEAGRTDAGRRYAVPPLRGPVQVVRDGGAPGRLYLLPRGGRRLVRLDLGDGAQRELALPRTSRALAVDAERRRGYVTNGVRGTLLALDLDRFEVEREAWLGGVPGPVEVLGGTGRVAVGTAMSGELLVLDAEDLGVRARLQTCPKVDPFMRLGGALRMAQLRDLVWDDAAHTLYVADACGVRRVRFPAPTSGAFAEAAP